MRAVVIGGGHAGGVAALALAGRGAEVTVLGREAHPPHERPSLSKAYLAGQEAEPRWIADEWPSAVTLRLGEEAASINREAKVVMSGSGDPFPYDTLFLAMGGACRTVEVPAAVRPFVRTVRTIDDAEALRPALGEGQRVLVIGGGVIGLEVAATARGRGAAVTVVEAGPRLMGRNTPADLAERVAELHEGAGVRVLTGTTVTGWEASADAVTATLSTGETVTADVVVVGIGLAPETALAEAAGLACDRGVLVGEDYRTADEAIFVIGDLAQRPAGGIETWDHAQSSAEAAVAAAFGEAAGPAKAPWFWTDQHGVNLQLAGDPMAGDQVVERSGGDVRLYYADGRLVGGVTWNVAREMGALRRLLDKGLSPSPEEAGDEAVSLKTLTKRASAPA